MKKLIYILSFAGIVLFNTSCEELIELNPEQSLSDQVTFSTAAGAEAALNGIYSQTQLLEVFGSGPQIFEDLIADNTEFVGSFPTIQDVRNYVTVSPNVTVESYWQVMYRVVNAANTVIDKVPGITDPALTASKKDEIIGQAKFLRGIVYFQLVNMFAQPYNRGNGNNPGVPLVLKGFDGVAELPSRATVAAVHDQIIKDLTEALAAVPATYPGSGLRGRATKGACAGFLSRIHLYRGEYDKAASFANQVLDNTASYGIANNFSFYSAPGAEHVFAILNSPTDNGRTGSGGWASYHRPAAQNGRGDCAFTTDLENVFKEEAGDKRYTELSDQVTAADNQSRRMTRKFMDAATNAEPAPLMRTSEMALTRSEALAELNGVNAESISLVNPIRVRAGLAAWTLAQFTSKEQLVTAILKERRKELSFEGHRRMDLLRRGQPLRTTGATATLATFGANRTVLPIPQREIDINKNLAQNPGY